ncbi:uncharacterized protein BDV17DRAFT_224200 [Aspergillus undulatus]|uniref:uncharacterized protein n=1 Tax=Aspergillus undulatus TaxID=1810928 RepID=UPI003CCCB74A
MPVRIDSALRNAEILDLSGELEAINLNALTTASKLTINSTFQSPCPQNLISVYRDLNRPDEATFCDFYSLESAGENPWKDYVRPTPVTPTPYDGTPTPMPFWTPTLTPPPSPTPGPPSGGLSAGESAAVGVLCSVVGVFGILGFVALRRRKKRAIANARAGRAKGVSGSGSASSSVAGSRQALAPAGMELAGRRNENNAAEGMGDAPPPYLRNAPR